MKRLIGFAALALTAAAFSGTAIGLPGGSEDPVQVAPSVDQVEILRCIGYQELRVGLHNTTGDHQYGDLFFQPTGPVGVSRQQFSSYAPIGQDVDGVPVRVTVPRDTPPGSYELGYRLGNTVQAPTPVSVVSDPTQQCVPPARMKATASSHQGDDVATQSVDGDPDTFWVSHAKELPQTITIDLGGTYTISEVRYQPRFDGVKDGDIGAYTLAVSADGKTFTDVRTSTWGYTEVMKTAKLKTPALAQKLRFTITGAAASVVRAAEFIPIGVPVDVPQVSATALTVPPAVVAGRSTVVPVSAGNWTNDPLEVEASVDVPTGWTTSPVRQVIPPGVVTQIPVTVTPPAGLPDAGVEPDVTWTAHAVPVGGGTSDGAPTATTWVAPDPAAQLTSAFDAGTASSPVAAGWSRLSPSELWTAGAIAGWVGSAPGSRDRESLDALRGDHVFSSGPATLRVAVPPGQYDVALLRGDAGAASGPTVVKAGGATLVAAGPALAAGEFAWERFVLDGGRTGRTADLTLSGDAGAAWTLAALVLRRALVQEGGGAGGTVPATLSLTVGAPATFGTFMPGAERNYDTSTSATVTSTAGDASLSAAGPVHLRNGTFSLAQPLEVTLSKAAWDAPVSNAAISIAFRQRVGASEALRTGGYTGTVTLTLATTNP